MIPDCDSRSKNKVDFMIKQGVIIKIVFYNSSTMYSIIYNKDSLLKREPGLVKTQTLEKHQTSIWSIPVTRFILTHRHFVLQFYFIIEHQLIKLISNKQTEYCSVLFCCCTKTLLSNYTQSWDTCHSWIML